MTIIPSKSSTQEVHISIIEDLINHLQMDKMIFEEGAATTEQQAFYGMLADSNPMKILHKIRIDTSKALIGKALTEYLNQLQTRNSQPNKIALSSSDSKIIVWAEINDDDETTEDSLLMSEAATNSEFSKYGLYFTTTIVESSDKATVPKHFKEVKLAPNG